MIHYVRVLNLAGEWAVVDRLLCPCAANAVALRLAYLGLAVRVTND